MELILDLLFSLVLLAGLASFVFYVLCGLFNLTNK